MHFGGPQTEWNHALIQPNEEVIYDHHLLMQKPRLTGTELVRGGVKIQAELL